MEITPYNNLFKDLEFWKKNFLNDNQLNLSQKSYKIYKNTIEKFIDFCVEKTSDFENFNITDLNKFTVSDFLLQYNSSSTKDTYLTILKKFFKYISENNENAIDLLERIEKLKIKKELKEPVYYTDNEIEKIKNHLLEYFQKTKSVNKKTKTFLLMLIAKTGIRAEECITLNKNSFTFIEYEKNEYFKIKIKGKGNKERFVYVKLNNFLIKGYENFLKNKKKITYDSLFTFNKTITRKLDISNKGLHAYRHYFARKWVEDNKNLQTLSELLGHTNISITSKYYAKASEKAKLNAIKDI